MTSGQISSGLDITYAPSTITTQQPIEGELDFLFEAMYDDYIGGQPSAAPRTVLASQGHQVRQTPMTSTSIADATLTPINSSSQATNFPNTSQDVDGLKTQQQHVHQQGNQAPLQPETVTDNALNAMFDENSNQLRSDGDMCMYALTVSTMEPKNVKEVMTDPTWIDSMQEELLQFKRLDKTCTCQPEGFIDADHPIHVYKLKKALYGLKQAPVKEKQENDKIGSKPDKNGKRVKAGKSLKQLQWVEEEKLSKTQKEWPKRKRNQKLFKFNRMKKRKGARNAIS
uniref:Gag-Pol polyprotein n=1 Tax=Tanacetum cinerariifolium TaxID=118510 RepID=A0A6L2P6Z7_TANCI|nr:hypothetical protein [Tanacetum cinerariifolium]